MESDGFEPAGLLRLCKGPWTVLACAGLVLLITFGVEQTTSVSILPLVFIGFVAVTLGVCIRPGDWRVLLAASGCSLLVVGSLPIDWDSLHLLFIVFAAAAAVCALVVPLSRMGRRMAVSGLILFHFAGISCAVMNVNPSPWLSTYLWAHCFQHYLNFIYMTNPYHFYSPEPSPGQMLWFDVRYDDGSDQWVKLPLRENQRWLLNYQRRTPLPDQVSQTVNCAIPPGRGHSEGPHSGGPGTALAFTMANLDQPSINLPTSPRKSCWEAMPTTSRFRRRIRQTRGERWLASRPIASSIA